MAAECVNGCINEHRILELEKDIQRNATTHKEFFDRCEKMMAYLTATVTDISKDVKEIKEKPAKRWDSVVMYLITSVIGAVVGFLLSGVIPM